MFGGFGIQTRRLSDDTHGGMSAITIAIAANALSRTWVSNKLGRVVPRSCQQILIESVPSHDPSGAVC